MFVATLFPQLRRDVTVHAALCESLARMSASWRALELASYSVRNPRCVHPIPSIRMSLRRWLPASNKVSVRTGLNECMTEGGRKIFWRACCVVDSV